MTEEQIAMVICGRTIDSALQCRTTTFISNTVMDNFIWNAKSYLMRKYGCAIAERDIAPLEWMYRTGRDPMAWRSFLTEKKPYRIAQLLHEGGSYEEAINRINKYIGWNDYINMGGN